MSFVLLPHSTFQCNPKNSLLSPESRKGLLQIQLTWTTVGAARFLSLLLSYKLFPLWHLYTGYNLDAHISGVKDAGVSIESNRNCFYCWLLAETNTTLSHERWEFTRKQTQRKIKRVHFVKMFTLVSECRNIYSHVNFCVYWLYQEWSKAQCIDIECQDSFKIFRDILIKHLKMTCIGRRM